MAPRVLTAYTDEMEQTKKRIVVLDTHAIIHRAYHALPEFRTGSGFPTGALYGLITMILRIVDELKPDYVIAAYDMPEKTFRHHIYDEYKGTRHKTDDELIMQIERSREIITAFNIPVYEAPGFEADDILGTIVEQTKDKEEYEIIIASGDMDTMQLVEGERVKVFTLNKGIKDTVMYDETAVRERFQFAPDLLPDYKGLRGDPSDNIPGIKGIGDKGATELITTYGTLEKIYEATEDGGVERLLADGISKRTANLLIGKKDEAEFSKILATIRRDAPIVFTVPARLWREGIDISAIEKITAEFELRTIWARAQALFAENGETGKTPVAESIDDVDLQETLLALWVVNSEMTNPKLDDLYQYTGKQDYHSAKQVVLLELKEKKLVDVYEKIELPIMGLVREMEKVGVAMDLEYLKKLSKEYHGELNKHEARVYELAGQEFNLRSPKQLSQILFDEMGLSTKGLKKTAGGDRSTRESELEKLRGEHEIIESILRYRELQKLLSTYIDNLPDMVGEDSRLHPKYLQAGTSTGRFSSADPNIQNIPIRSEYGHRVRAAFVAEPGYSLVACDYAQVELRVAAILSGDDYLTKTFQEGIDVHTAVAAKVFGVETTEVTREQRARAKTINFGILYGMGVTALMKNLETTRQEAQEFYNAYFEEFASIAGYLEETKRFALQYGYTETLFGRRRYFPALKSRLPYIRAQAERMAINAPIQGTATADIIKIAMRHVDEALKKEKIREQVRFIMQVHDELVFEIKDEYIDRAKPIIKVAMEGVLQNSFRHIETAVPLLVDIGTGKNWSEVK